MLKARRNIKKGLPVERPTLKSARRRIKILYGTTWIILIILVLSFIADGFFMPDIVTLAVLGPGVGTIIGLSIRYYIKKKSSKKGAGVKYILLAFIFIIIFMPKIASLITDGFEDIYKVDSPPEGYPIVTIEELVGHSIGGNEISREFKPGSSPLVPKHYDYRELVNIDGNTKTITIKYYNTINPYFAERIFKGINDRLEKGIKWRGMTIFQRNIIIDDEMKNLWTMDNMVLTEERDEIIIQKGNKVLHLLGDIDYDEDKTKELIINRFFLDSGAYEEF
ncbi:MAG: hypothetical protein GX339_01355 [Tissierellia bacterium]|nr:hypothetical protein [Tissierellia bacterium]